MDLSKTLDPWLTVPTDLNSSNLLSVAENQTVGSYVGEFLAIDTDGDVLTYHLIDGVTDNALFILEENGTLYSAIEFDYEKDTGSIIKYK